MSLATCGPTVLACGAWLKNTICLTRDNNAYVSPIIGDLSAADNRYRFDNTVRRMCRDYSISPEIVAHDLHPDFYSTQFAQALAEQHDLPIVAVQHHHAHIGAICAEHHINQPVLGLALDGVGMGEDHSFWGGELLLVDGAQCSRLGHLAPLALPGGDRAAREPWRMAAAVLAKLNRHDEITQRYSDQPAADMVAFMLKKNLNCPPISSMGRLFDAAAGLLNVHLIQSHEAEAAMTLQQLAQQHGAAKALADGYQITHDNQLDFSPLLSALIDCRDANGDIAYAASLFHATVIEGLASWVKKAADQYQISRLALGGGCFHNAILTHGLSDQLLSSSLQISRARRLLPDDSAIALGQAWVALQHNAL
ncbi:MAG: carbamoyltransferase HypF [Nitrosomonas sp.]|nr:carbamoyltransferase HypF [Nitrosomonas sp.]